MGAVPFSSLFFPPFFSSPFSCPMGAVPFSSVQLLEAAFIGHKGDLPQESRSSWIATVLSNGRRKNPGILSRGHLCVGRAHSYLLADLARSLVRQRSLTAGGTEFPSRRSGQIFTSPEKEPNDESTQ